MRKPNSLVLVTLFLVLVSSTDVSSMLGSMNNLFKAGTRNIRSFHPISLSIRSEVELSTLNHPLSSIPRAELVDSYKLVGNGLDSYKLNFEAIEDTENIINIDFLKIDPAYEHLDHYIIACIYYDNDETPILTQVKKFKHDEVTMPFNFEGEAICAFEEISLNEKGKEIIAENISGEMILELYFPNMQSITINVVRELSSEI